MEEIQLVKARRQKLRAFALLIHGFHFAAKAGILVGIKPFQEMTRVNPLPEVESELTRRHKAAATTVAGLLVATILLSVVAYLGRPYFTEQPNPSLNMAVRILGGILGLGAVVWRRNKFSTMRLQDIGGLQGASGVMRTLEKTTLQLAFLGVAIAAIGFIATLMTGDETFTYWSGIITILVLLYCYPTKSSWRKAVLQFADPRVGAA